METGALGFAIFLTAILVMDGFLYSRGHNAAFFKHKTPEELRIREAQIRKLEIEAGIRDENGKLREESQS